MLLCLTTAVSELVEQFYHATENRNVTNAISAWADQPLQTKYSKRRFFRIKWSIAQHNPRYA